MTDRFDAAIDGYDLECETLRENIRKSIAEYRYPYRDGADTEDMGAEAWETTIRCYFYGPTYDRHFEFLQHLNSRELFELTHPKYGIKKGRIKTLAVQHDDRENMAEVDITFLEDMSSQETAVSTHQIDVVGETEESFIAGQDELMDAFRTAARSAAGTEAGDILDEDLDEDLGIVEQFPGVSTTARNWLKSVEAFETTIEAAASGVSNPSNSLLSMINFGTNLPGRVVGAIARAAERFAVLYETLKDSPVRYLQNIRTGMSGLSDDVDILPGLVVAAGAQRLAVEASIIYGEDEEVRNQQRRREEDSTGGAFDIAGNLVPREDIAAVMTVRDLEQSLADVRTELQAAIDADRTLTQMKVMARNLLDHVSVIKLERDRIVRILLDNPMPLQAVCMLRGLSIEYAERILAINDIKEPNFTAGEIDVYAA